MALAELRECRRKSLLKKHLPSQNNKPFVLRNIMFSALKQTGYGCGDLKEMEDIIDSEFEKAENTGSMFAFEAASEKQRMKECMARFYVYEGSRWQWMNCAILGEDLFEEVMFAGELHKVRIDLLLTTSRGIEAIKYFYKVPSMTKTGAKSMQNNPDMLLLTLAAEKFVQKNYPKYIGENAYAHFFYMRGKNDNKGIAMDGYEGEKFADKKTFLTTFQRQKDALEAEFLLLKPNLNQKLPKTASACFSCAYSDLCHTSFKACSKVVLPPPAEEPVKPMNLTEAQRKFIDFDRGICQVLAVAGSGKTTMATLRNIRLLEGGVNPEAILMITFTEKAKAEMRNRLTRYLSHSPYVELGLDGSSVVIETFNSWGQSLIEKHYEKLGMKKAPTLIDDVEKKEIIIALLEKNADLPFDHNNPFMAMRFHKGSVVKMVEILDTMKASNVQDTAGAAECLVKHRMPSDFPIAKRFLKIYQAYNKTLLKRHLLDYEDQLRLLLQLKDERILQTLPY